MIKPVLPIETVADRVKIEARGRRVLFKQFSLRNILFSCHRIVDLYLGYEQSLLQKMFTTVRYFVDAFAPKIKMLFNIFFSVNFAYRGNRIPLILCHFARTVIFHAFLIKHKLNKEVSERF